MYIIIENLAPFHPFSRMLYTVTQKNAPTFASLDKHGLILIIFGQQHQHTFKN